VRFYFKHIFLKKRLKSKLKEKILNRNQKNFLKKYLEKNQQKLDKEEKILTRRKLGQKLKASWERN